MLKWLIPALLCGVTLAHAQTAPTQIGVTSASPNAVQVLDSTRNWATIGTIVTATHTFTPANLTPDAPNDATLYGRKSAAWSHLTHNDITDWAASVPPPTPPGGATGTIQYNTGSGFGGFTANGDGTINTGTGAMLVTKTNGVSFGALATTVPGAGVAAAHTPALNASGGLASAAAPLTTGGSGSISGAFGYYICTGACTITLPTPAAGFQFCIRNDSTVVTVITIAAISSVQFEKTTYNGYGTAGTGTMISGGALGDKICLIGRDATHYLVGSYVGTWTNS